MTDNSILPARTVQPREQLFPSLSICYRTIAQQEIWCITSGGSALQDYCGMFKSSSTPPERQKNLTNLVALFNSGSNDSAASAETCQAMAKYALFDCATGGSTAINPPDPTRPYPCLTSLYQYYVLDGNDQSTAASIAVITSSLAGELFNVRLVW
jgi:hypothetical protein